jgi:hypothetical protein
MMLSANLPRERNKALLKNKHSANALLGRILKFFLKHVVFFIIRCTKNERMHTIYNKKLKTKRLANTKEFKTVKITITIIHSKVNEMRSITFLLFSEVCLCMQKKMSLLFAHDLYRDRSSPWVHICFYKNQ